MSRKLSSHWGAEGSSKKQKSFAVKVKRRLRCFVVSVALL